MNGSARMLPQSRLGWLGLAVATAALAALPYLASPYYVGLATTTIIFAMLALSLHLLVGATGLVSLGHGAFFGLAAYVVYLLSPEGAPRPMWQTLPAAMAMAGLASLIVGSLSLRTKGFFFLMVTLAFGQMIYFVFHDTKLGGGTDGAYLAKPVISALGLTLDPQSLPRSRRGWPSYYVALTQMVVIYLVLAFLLRSLFGRVLEGIRVNEHRMEAMGFHTTRYKLAAFVIAGTLAGAAGHMWSLHTGSVNPELVSWHKSAEALLMILLGGIGSLAGAVVGAFAYMGLNEIGQVIQLRTERAPIFGVIVVRKLLFEGIVILTAVILLRNGIMGIRWPWRGASAAAHGVPAAAASARSEAAEGRSDG
jgi:branched-chain amino acid transport system permease protein